MASGNSLCFPAPLSDGASSYPPLSGSMELNRSHCAVLLSRLRALGADPKANSLPFFPHFQKELV